MEKYILHLSDGEEVDVEIEATDDNDALSIALTALMKFASIKFPPPDRIEIDVMDLNRNTLATLRFRFEIDAAKTSGQIIPFPVR